ncbi:MAG: hydantoinase/oxoprolinase family protein [Parvibaculales bacterium]
MIRVGVDVGGTFTDLILVNNDDTLKEPQVVVHKLPSTPEDQSIAVVDGIKQICDIAAIAPQDIDLVLHGTTVATNITLEHNGANVGMITTKGFRDIMHIGRLQRPENFSLHFDVPWQSRPLVRRRNRIAVTERILPPGGEVETVLDEDEVRAAVHKLKEQGVEAITICFLFSFLNDTHEKRAKEIVREIWPEVYVSCSSEVVNMMREYERFSTTAINAFVGPKTSKYLNNLESKLKDMGMTAGLRIMQSNGGVSTVPAASSRPVSILMSGLAGGVVGGRWAANMSDEKNVISIDIGGTSADISVVNNNAIKIKNPRDCYVGGYPVLAPMMDLVTIGAGGGSIAFIDAGGAFRVGPRSAGATPGPACYGRGGTEPTVTDANLVLGRLDAKSLVGGSLELDYDLAYKAIDEHIARKLGMSVEEAALGILEIINANMAMSIRANSVARGIDPRDFVLSPFGGAGPLHGVALAEIIGAKAVIVPPEPGINAAIGMLLTDTQYEFSGTQIRNLSNLTAADYDKINATLKQIRTQALDQLTQDGFDESELHFELIAECRYVGQGFELRANIENYPVTPDNIAELQQAFHNSHELEYGHAFPDQQVELITLRCLGTRRAEPLVWPEATNTGSGIEGALLGMAATTFAKGESVDTPRYDRSKLSMGDKIQGPAIISQHNSTTLVPPAYCAEINKFGNIEIRAEA